jgi:hypothetical protein
MGCMTSPGMAFLEQATLRMTIASGCAVFQIILPRYEAAGVAAAPVFWTAGLASLI